MKLRCSNNSSRNETWTEGIIRSTLIVLFFTEELQQLIKTNKYVKQHDEQIPYMSVVNY